MEGARLLELVFNRNVVTVVGSTREMFVDERRTHIAVTYVAVVYHVFQITCCSCKVCNTVPGTVKCMAIPATFVLVDSRLQITQLHDVDNIIIIIIIIIIIKSRFIYNF